MRSRLVSLILLVVLGSGCVQATGQAKPTSPTSPGEEQPQSCLLLARIFSTDVVDNQTILFRMLDGKIWRNRLPRPCTGLALQQGFAYVTSLHQLCSLDLIRVLGPSPTVCSLGRFEPYAPPRGPGANPANAPGETLEENKRPAE